MLHRSAPCAPLECIVTLQAPSYCPPSPAAVEWFFDHCELRCAGADDSVRALLPRGALAAPLLVDAQRQAPPGSRLWLELDPAARGGEPLVGVFYAAGGACFQLQTGSMLAGLPLGLPWPAPPPAACSTSVASLPHLCAPKPFPAFIPCRTPLTPCLCMQTPSSSLHLTAAWRPWKSPTSPSTRECVGCVCGWVGGWVGWWGGGGGGPLGGGPWGGGGGALCREGHAVEATHAACSLLPRHSLFACRQLPHLLAWACLQLPLWLAQETSLHLSAAATMANTKWEA